MTEWWQGPGWAAYVIHGLFDPCELGVGGTVGVSRYSDGIGLGPGAERGLESVMTQSEKFSRVFQFSEFKKIII